MKIEYWHATNNEPRVHLIMLYKHEHPDRLAEVYAWCVDQFGPPDPERTGRWTCHSKTHYWFVSDTDATAFKIRWA